MLEKGRIGNARICCRFHPRHGHVIVMHSGHVQSALLSVSPAQAFTFRSPRSEKAKKEVDRLLGVAADSRFTRHWEIFSEQLVSSIAAICDQDSQSAEPLPLKRAALWSKFHRLRVEMLPRVWREFLCNVDESLDVLIQQYVNQKVFEDIITARFGCVSSIKSRTATLTSDEENIIRYAAGYVPFSLLKKHKKSSSALSSAYIDCLIGLSVCSADDDDSDGTGVVSLMNYTLEWMKRVNRGGLFEVSDKAFLLFREIELTTRDALMSSLQSRHSDGKNDISSLACADAYVVSYWEQIACDLNNAQSMSLLKEIVDLWITIRGHSIAGQFLAIRHLLQAQWHLM